MPRPVLPSMCPELLSHATRSHSCRATTLHRRISLGLPSSAFSLRRSRWCCSNFEATGERRSRATSLASRYSPAHLDGEELGFAHWRHIALLADAGGSA